jgi:hypothetical protein
MAVLMPYKKKRFGRGVEYEDLRGGSGGYASLDLNHGPRPYQYRPTASRGVIPASAVVVMVWVIGPMAAGVAAAAAVSGSGTVRSLEWLDDGYGDRVS